MDVEFAINNMEVSDIAGLKDLVKKEWFMSYKLPEDALQFALDFYVGRYLCRATSAYKFETGGKTTGYLLGYAAGEEYVFPGPEPELGSAEGPHVDEFKRIMEADDRMLESCKDMGFDSELLLFIVDSECRGMRIGSRLLDRFARDAVGSGHKLMYLFTDDYCNMGFYERIGCEVAAREKVYTDEPDRTFVMLKLDLINYVNKKQ